MLELLEHDFHCSLCTVQVKHLETLPGNVLLVNEFLTPSNRFHGLGGKESVASWEANSTARLLVPSDVNVR